MLAVTIVALSLGSRHVRLAAVGDVMLARWVSKRIERQGPGEIFAGVASELQKADVLVGNLECALTQCAPVSHKPILLRADPRLAAELGRVGFSALSLANNHSRDCGLMGVKESRAALAAANIKSVGPEPTPVIIEKNGLKIGILGLVDLPDDALSPRGEWRRAMSKLRKKVDVVSVMIHWGTEGSDQESPSQRRLAQTLANLGADVILGSHPHVLQPVRWIRGQHHRRCLVAYSLGNFVFDARPGNERKTEILSIELAPAGAVTFQVMPVRIDKGFPILVKARKAPLPN